MTGIGDPRRLGPVFDSIGSCETAPELVVLILIGGKYTKFWCLVPLAERGGICYARAMKILYTLLVGAALCASPLVSAAVPKIIFDTDMVEDYDDVGAMAVLHALADEGKCEILAISTCTRDNSSVAAV